MTRSRKTPRKTARTAAPPAAPAAADTTTDSIVERPDGYYWLGHEGDEEFGPYESFELAAAARDAVSEEAVAPASALLQAQREIGIADWLDAETGEPAEGQSPPHLQED